MAKKTAREKARESFTVQAKDTAECVVVPLHVLRSLEAEVERLRERIAELEAAAAPPSLEQEMERLQTVTAAVRKHLA